MQYMQQSLMLCDSYIEANLVIVMLGGFIMLPHM